MLLTVCIFLVLIDETMFSNADCMISVPPQSRKFEVYLKGFTWVLPSDDFKEHKRYTSEGEEVKFFCENGFVDDTLPGKTYYFICQDGKYNNTYYYEDLMCKSEYHKRTRTYVISNLQLGSDIFKCEGRNREVYQVGLEKPDGKFHSLYKVCFDKNVMRAKFTFLPPRNIKWDYEEEKEVRWDVWGFDRFGKTAWERLKLSDGYVSKLQRFRITNEYPQKYSFENHFPYTYSRGHLTTFSHFMKSDERKTTCQYINAIPQWKELNRYMWTYIEQEIRDLLEKDPYEWEIYTGSYGSIPTAKGSPLFLSPFFDPEGKVKHLYVPVPKLIWKYARCLYNEKHSKVYVGVNNPEFRTVNEITKDYIICKPIVRDKETIRGSASKGYVYECQVEEFLTKLAIEERIVKMAEPTQKPGQKIQNFSKKNQKSSAYSEV